MTHSSEARLPCARQFVFGELWGVELDLGASKQDETCNTPRTNTHARTDFIGHLVRCSPTLSLFFSTRTGSTRRDDTGGDRHIVEREAPMKTSPKVLTSLINTLVANKQPECLVVSWMSALLIQKTRVAHQRNDRTCSTDARSG